jgi:phosphate transport system substrate-binding protein
VRINYQSIGSGGGIRQFAEGPWTSRATDGPMNDEQIKGVNGNVLHVPTVLGAVVVSYNLPEVTGTPLRFDGATLADVFLGRITKWNDTRLAALNPGAKLPAKDIIVVTVPMGPALPSSSRTTCPRFRPTGRERSAAPLGSVADWARREGE